MPFKLRERIAFFKLVEEVMITLCLFSKNCNERKRLQLLTAERFALNSCKLLHPRIDEPLRARLCQSLTSRK